MADWGSFDVKFDCSKERFDTIREKLFKYYDGKLKLNFDMFINDFDGDSQKYDSDFRFWLTEYLDMYDNGFMFYCKSLPLLQYLVIRISEIIDCDFNVMINHPSYQCSIEYKIKNRKLKEKRVVGYMDYAYGDPDNIPFYEYEDDGFAKLEQEIGYKRG